MKKSVLIFILTLGAFSGTSWRASASLIIPDGNPSGVSDTQTLISSIASINSVSVNLDISSEFNGDLYVYLRHGSAISVLLNRTGRTAADSSGYTDTGFNVVFSDAAGSDIHNYQTIQTPITGWTLTGSWAPDARTADPDLVTDASGRSAFLSAFNGMSAGGDWTLFLADLSTGDTSVLNNWSLSVEGTSSVPEPSTYITGVLLLLPFGVSTIRILRSRRLYKGSDNRAKKLLD